MFDSHPIHNLNPVCLYCGEDTVRERFNKNIREWSCGSHFRVIHLLDFPEYRDRWVNNGLILIRWNTFGETDSERNTGTIIREANSYTIIYKTLEYLSEDRIKSILRAGIKLAAFT